MENEKHENRVYNLFKARAGLGSMKGAIPAIRLWNGTTEGNQRMSKNSRVGKNKVEEINQKKRQRRGIYHRESRHLGHLGREGGQRKH